MGGLLVEAQGLHAEMVRHRRHLHENAEIQFDLPITTAYVVEKLKDMGYEPQEICRSGIVATVGGKKPGKAFLLRADMDALPFPEATDLPFKSKTGYMHACGHDLHTSMLLGAAQLLKLHEDEIEGQVKLMFQPAEEVATGAEKMLEAGLLENPKVDAAMMVHVFTGIPVPPGLVGIAPAGAFTAAADAFKVTVQGKGGHGAMPNMTIDPLNVIAHTHLALQAINSREVAPNDIVALTVGQIHGGTAFNVIPDTAFLQGTIRTFSRENRAFIKKRIEEIAAGVASTFRASAAVEYSNGCPSVINDPDLVRQFIEYSRGLLGNQQVVNLGELGGGALSKSSGAEDFGFISELIPSIMVVLFAGSSDEDCPYPQHHPKAIFKEEYLFVGAALYANTAMEWLKNNK